jgi:hypothetical protein
VTSRSATVAAYAALILTLVVLEAVARRRPEALASVSGMVRRVCRTRSGQLCLVLAWWWLGWHFLLGT